MKKTLFLIAVLTVTPMMAFAQSQYQYEASKLTAEQQHMLEQVKMQNQVQAQKKNLSRYRDEAKNPENYRSGRTYNAEKKSYR